MGTSILDADEAGPEVLPILHGLELRVGARVVVADGRSAFASGYAEVREQTANGLPAHAGAAIGTASSRRTSAHEASLNARFVGECIELQIIADAPASFILRWPAGRVNVTDLGGGGDGVEAELGRARAGLMIESIGAGFKLKVLDELYNCGPVIPLHASFVALPADGLRGLHDGARKGHAGRAQR